MAAENNNSNYYISSLLRKLQSSSLSSVQKALISLSRATRKSDNVVKLREEGGIKLLLTFIQSSNKKSLDMAVSVLANCALEGRSRTEIWQNNGVALLCNLLASLAETSILSRVTRALANLSQDETLTHEILNLDVVPKLIDILSESSDVHLLQNTLRAFRILGRSEMCILQLERCNKISKFVELLRNENSNEIKSCCLQTLLELTKTDGSGVSVIGEQLQEHGGIELISQLSYLDDQDIAEKCINLLCTITTLNSVRVSVGTMGGIAAFIYHIQARGPLVLRSVEGLCMCCREAVNRNKARSCGGLEVLLSILRSPEYRRVFDNVLGAFVCFTYDDLALKRLLGCGLISTLVSILQKLIFPKNRPINVASEKQDNDSSKSSHKNTTTNTPKTNATFLSSERVPNVTVSTSTPGLVSPTSGSSLTPLPSLRASCYPESSSPPNCISPNLSPELRVSLYMSPYSPQCSLSPVVYSPSGSEDEFSSECSDGNPEQDTVETDDKARVDTTAAQSSKSTSCNDVTVSKDFPVTSGEGITSTEGLPPTNVNVLDTLMEDLATTHSGDMAATSEGVNMKLDETDNEGPVLKPLQNERDSTPDRASDSTSESRVPLLPGANFNEHVHLFLPNENLFSADQPSPRQLQPRATRRSRRTSCDASRGTTRDTSSAPHDISTTSFPLFPSSPLNVCDVYGVEYKIIYLLSRFGQMPDTTYSEALTSPECIQTLLDYLCHNPDSRCVRLLSRIVWDREYFEKLVIIMFPGAIYRQLVCGLRPSYLLSKLPHSSSGTDVDNNTKEPLPMQESSGINTLDHENDRFGNQPAKVVPLVCASSTNSSTTKSPEHKSTKGKPACASSPDLNDTVTLYQSATNTDSSPDVPQTSGLKRIDSDSVQSDQVGSKHSYPSSHLTSKRQKQDVCLDATQEIIITTQDNFLPCRTKDAGISLLSILTTQACTSFGEGILAHLLLRGTQKQKEACALSLPYLCKPLRMKSKLLVDHKGILVILSILCDSTEQADIIRAIDSLTYLVSNSALKMNKNFERFTGRYSTGNASASVRRKNDDLAYWNLFNFDKKTGLTSQSSSKSPKEQGVPCMTLKRVREVDDDITSKRKKMESSSAQREICCNNCSYKATHLTPFDVVIKVDSGESIEANRAVLCAFSDVFAVMFCSDFIEASQSEIAVKDINYRTILFLVHYAYGCSWSFAGSNNCPSLDEYLSERFEVECLLDLLMCADRFLLTGLKDQCEELTMYCVESGSVVHAYLAAACYNAPRLRVHCLLFTFLGNLDLRCVYRCVIDLLESEERDRVIEDFKNIALDCCTLIESDD